MNSVSALQQQTKLTSTNESFFILIWNIKDVEIRNSKIKAGKDSVIT